MRISPLLDELRAKNIVVFLENGKVKVDAEEAVLTGEFLVRLKANRSVIVQELTAERERERALDSLVTSPFFPGWAKASLF